MKLQIHWIFAVSSIFLWDLTQHSLITVSCSPIFLVCEQIGDRKGKLGLLVKTN